MRRIALLGAAGAIVIVLVVAQLVLPGIAAQRLRDRLARSGTVLNVQVHAFPAIELLWHNADSVTIRMGQYRSGTGRLGSLLAEAGDVGSLSASAQVLQAGLLTLHDASLQKRGNRLSGTARVSEADLRAAVPVLESVVPVASGGGQLTLRGTASLFGVTASVDATLHAQDGALVVTPDVPFGGFATISVFSNPRVYVDGVAATPLPGGFAVSASATLH
jgi:hypothetical protein